MRKQFGLKLFVIPVFLFLFIPLFIIIVTSFGEKPTIQFPIEGFTLDWYANVFTTGGFLTSFWLSLRISFLATLLALIIGVPAAYVLSRYDFPGRKRLKSFFMSRWNIPWVVVGFALFQFIVNRMKIPSFIGLLLGHFLISLSYIIRVVGSSVEQLDMSLEFARSTVGCTSLVAFFRIVFPNT